MILNKYLMTFTLILISSISFASELCANSLDQNKCFVDQMNTLFNTSIQLEVTTDEGSHAKDNTIYLSLEDSKLPTDERYFTLAHEYSHVLMGDTIVPQGVEVPLNHFVEKEAQLSPEEKEAQIFLQIGHENIDAMAAKILRNFGIKITPALNWFDSIDVTTFPNFKMLKEILMKRKNNIKVSYAQGWNNWSNYHFSTPICDNGKIIDFLMDKKFIKIKEIISSNINILNPSLQNIYVPISNQCIVYALDSILNTVKDWRALDY